MLRSLSFGLTLIASQLGAQSLALISVTPVTGGGHHAGGLSAIEMETGALALTVSDRGHYFDIALARDSNGMIVSAVATASDIGATELDAEGLAIGPGGRFASYEGPGMVRRIGGAPLPRHRDFRRFSINRALEALAIDAGGRLYALPEKASGTDGTFALYVFEDGRWTIPRTFQRQGSFLPVGADFGPDGLLYVLERSVSLFGFRSQVRRFDVSDPDARGETLLRTTIFDHDNLEGIALWRTGAGNIRVTMVSDDNFWPLLRSEIVEYQLTE